MCCAIVGVVLLLVLLQATWLLNHKGKLARLHAVKALRIQATDWREQSASPYDRQQSFGTQWGERFILPSGN